MEIIKRRLANLLSVRSFVTLVLTGVFAFVLCTNQISQDFMTIYAVIIAFCSGTQNQKAQDLMDYPKGEQVMIKATELVNKAIDIAENDETLYVMGCFGAPLTAANKKRYTTNHSYNKAAACVKTVNAASEDTSEFDYVCLIKGVLWGWCGGKNRTYGGTKYASNGIPDIGVDQMVTKCPDASTTGWTDMEPGEMVWTTGHTGIYIGDSLAVECTPKWKNCVQITAVDNIDSKARYNTRTQKKHSRIPYVEYPGKVDTPATAPDKKPPTPVVGKEVRGTGVTTRFDKSLTGTCTITARNGLNVRNAAGTNQDISVSTPKGTKVQNYGCYTPLGGVGWLYVKFTYQNVTYTGFCFTAHLKKRGWYQ